MSLHFHSNGYLNGQGFYLRWYIFSNGCGGNLVGLEGIITSPFYPNPYMNEAECEWKILVPQGSMIRLIIEDLALEYSSECRYDVLELFDGTNQFKQRLASLCNELSNNQSLIYTSTKNEALIRFVADDSNRGRGFLLKYESICHVTLTKSFGIIESPNYNRSNLNIKDNDRPINCTWIIKATRNNYIYFEVFHYNSQNDEQFILLQDGNKMEKIQNPYYIYNSSGDTITIKQLSNLVQFQLEYQMIGCIHTFHANTANFTTPNYPNFYNNNMDCAWEIIVLPHHGIELTIKDMDIEETINCTKDSLIITSHPDQAANHKEYHCGKGSNLIISSASHTLFVHFRSDSSGNGRGFSATYRVIEKCQYF